MQAECNSQVETAIVLQVQSHAMLLTRRAMRAPLTLLFPSPRTNSSQGSVGGASGAYRGVKENLCLQTCKQKRLIPDAA